jgi:hypothetical protein
MSARQQLARDFPAGLSSADATRDETVLSEEADLRHNRWCRNKLAASCPD